MIPHLIFMLLFCHLKMFHFFSFYCLKSNIMSSFITHIIIRRVTDQDLLHSLSIFLQEVTAGTVIIWLESPK